MESWMNTRFNTRFVFELSRANQIGLAPWNKKNQEGVIMIAGLPPPSSPTLEYGHDKKKMLFLFHSFHSSNKYKFHNILVFSYLLYLNAWKYEVEVFFWVGLWPQYLLEKNKFCDGSVIKGCFLSGLKRCWSQVQRVQKSTKKDK